ncbi:MAG: hypothetical protein QM692_21140 [Thermomicrobiales bacterium]
MENASPETTDEQQQRQGAAEDAAPRPAPSRNRRQLRPDPRRMPPRPAPRGLPAECQRRHSPI